MSDNLTCVNSCHMGKKSHVGKNKTTQVKKKINMWKRVKIPVNYIEKLTVMCQK